MGLLPEPERLRIASSAACPGTYSLRLIAAQLHVRARLQPDVDRLNSAVATCCTQSVRFGWLQPHRAADRPRRPEARRTAQADFGGRRHRSRGLRRRRVAVAGARAGLKIGCPRATRRRRRGALVDIRRRRRAAPQVAVTTWPRHAERSRRRPAPEAPGGRLGVFSHGRRSLQVFPRWVDEHRPLYPTWHSSSAPGRPGMALVERTGGGVPARR
jgi:hypothetical protein